MSSALEVLKRERKTILFLAQKYGASNIRIFGSVSRGEETDESDIDILADFEADC